MELRLHAVFCISAMFGVSALAGAPVTPLIADDLKLGPPTQSIGSGGGDVPTPTTVTNWPFDDANSLRVASQTRQRSFTLLAEPITVTSSGFWFSDPFDTNGFSTIAGVVDSFAGGGVGCYAQFRWAPGFPWAEVSYGVDGQAGSIQGCGSVENACAPR